MGEGEAKVEWRGGREEGKEGGIKGRNRGKGIWIKWKGERAKECEKMG